MAILLQTIRRVGEECGRTESGPEMATDEIHHLEHLRRKPERVKQGWTVWASWAQCSVCRGMSILIDEESRRPEWIPDKQPFRSDAPCLGMELKS